jgi:hypothetical protein
MDTENTNTVD